MLMVSYFTVLLRIEDWRELEFAYDRVRLIVLGIREVSTPVGLPWSHTVIPTLWDLNYKCVSPLVISLCHSRDDTAALLENTWDPPNKSRSIKQVIGDLVFGNLNRVTFFQVR
jgi:hypothetical protein